MKLEVLRGEEEIKQLIHVDEIDWDDSIVSAYQNGRIILFKKEDGEKLKAQVGRVSLYGSNKYNSIGTFSFAEYMSDKTKVGEDEICCFTGEDAQREFIEWALEAVKMKRNEKSNI